MKTLISLIILCECLFITGAIIVAWIVFAYKVKRERIKQTQEEQETEAKEQAKNEIKQLYAPVITNFNVDYSDNKELADLMKADEGLSNSIKQCLKHYKDFPESYELAINDLQTYDDDSKLQIAVQYLKRVFRDTDYAMYLLKNINANSDNRNIFNRIIESFEIVIANKKLKLKAIKNVESTYKVMQLQKDEAIASSGDLSKMNNRQKSRYYANYYDNNADNWDMSQDSDLN